MKAGLLHTVNNLLNGRTLEESLLYYEECKFCKHFVNKSCDLRNDLQYCQLLATGICQEWRVSVAERFAQSNDGRIKIIFPTIALLCGGAERWLVDLATGLNPEKYNICIGIQNRGATDKDLLARAEKSCSVVYGKRHLQTAMDGADIVLSWCYFPKSKAHYHIFCSHGCDYWTDKLVAENGDAMQRYRFTAVSSLAARPWQHLSKSHIIYNGCKADRLKATIPRDVMRRKLKTAPNEILIGFISRLIPEKNPWIVAIAAHELRNRGFNAKAIFVGDCKPSVQKFDNCAYIPKTEEIGNILHALDCFMLPSNSEAFSLAITEAWLAAIPVVATPVGAIRELEQKYGKMVVRSTTSPSNDVLQAISEGNKSVVENAYKVSHENFTTEAMVNRWEKYFHELTTA